MSAGRGQFFQSLLQGLQQQDRPGVRRDQKKRPARQRIVSSRPALLPLPVPSPPQTPYPLKPSPLPPRLHQQHTSPFPLTSSITYSTITTPYISYSRENYFDRLPPEIILKIFSYLDANSLFSVGFVNRQFQKLSNDNALWYELYVNETAKKKWKPRLAILPDNTTSVQDMPQGFWKRLVFRELGCPKEISWKKELRYINPYTGMPVQTKQLLGSLRVSWEITLTNKTGQEIVYKQNHTFFSDSSVTVCWNSGMWPPINQVSTLQLHGVIRPFTTASTDKPQWRSLISKTDVCRDEKWRFIGTDKLVKLMFFDDGITVGIWRGTWIIAFIMANLHFHRLLERSLLGSSSCSYKLLEVIPLYDDGDPDSGLQGYTVLVVLHNSVRRILHRRYFPVHCRKDEQYDGFAQFKLMSEHTPVVGRISFPWTAEGLQGDIKDCCMMTLTVLDEVQKPFWCISTSAPLILSSFREHQVVLKYNSVEGMVTMRLMWMQEIQQYFLVSLQVRVTLTKLNKHFRREIFSSKGP